MRYNLTDLRLFVAVAEAQNLTRGAERAHLAPSSASHRLQQLEGALGTALFIRRARGVELTRAGEALLRHARQVFAQLEQMHADLAPFAAGVRGHVTLWANTHATHSFLPDDLAEFLRANPQVSVTLEEHTSPEIVMAVARGEVEVGVVAETVEGAEVEMIPYRADRLVLITPAAHPLAQRKRLKLSQLVDQPLLVREAGSGTRLATEQFLAEHGVQWSPRMALGSNEAIKHAVRAGLGLAVLSRHTLSADLSGTGVTVLPVAGFPIRRMWHLVWRKDRPLSLAARTLLQDLRRHLGVRTPLSSPS